MKLPAGEASCVVAGCKPRVPDDTCYLCDDEVASAALLVDLTRRPQHHEVVHLEPTTRFTEHEELQAICDSREFRGGEAHVVGHRSLSTQAGNSECVSQLFLCWVIQIRLTRHGGRSARVSGEGSRANMHREQTSPS